MAKRKGIYFTEEECNALMGAFIGYSESFDFSQCQNVDDLGCLGTKDSISALRKLKVNGYKAADMILQDIEAISQ